MKLTKQVEAEVVHVYDTWLNSYISGDVDVYNSFFDNDYRFIGSTNNEEFLNRNDTTKFFETTAAQLAGKTDIRNSTKTIRQFGDLIFITHLLDAWFLNGTEWSYYGRFRFTSALKKNKEDWRFIYQHFSTPDSKAQEGETIGYEQVTAENIQLREAIKRRTIELEQKNRELAIEAALERVRARAMAMHNTSELQEVITTVHKELINLNIAISGGSFIAINSEIETNLRCWGSGGTADTSEEVLLPLYEKPFCTNLINGIKKGPEFFTEEFTQQEKKDFFTFLLKHEPWSKLDAKQKKELLSSPGGYTRSCCVSQHTSIFIINHFGEKFSEEDNDILKRFSKVFEQTYTRFLDLQKADAQAREAQIEAALEKVRSRSLAMHKSDELKEVVTVVFEKLRELDLVFDGGAVIVIFTEGSKDLTYWIASDLLLTSSSFRFPYFDHPLVNMYDDAREQGMDFFSKVYSLEDKNNYYTYAFEHSDFKYLPDDLKNYIIESKSIGVSFALSKHSAILTPSFSGELISEQRSEVLKRFARVFEQAYTRFLDLKKAEAQAREAKIEAALERIRSRTMAMHKSDELNETNTVIIQQIKSLEIRLYAFGIHICHAEEPVSEAWMGDPVGGYIPKVIYDHSQDPLSIRMYSGWKERQTLIVEKLEGEALKEHFEYMFSLVSDRSIFDNLVAPDSLVFHFAYFTYGFFVFLMQEHCAKEYSFFKRVAKVFEQTYTRFLDLQKAEAQAREATIEVALERVRSRAMAMHKSDELLLAGELLYRELTKLGIVSFTCGYVLMDEEEKFGWIYAASPADSTILPKPTGLPHESEVMGSIRASWKKQEPFHVVELDPEATIEHHTYLAKNSIDFLFTLEEFLSISPEGVVLHSFNFRQGYILVVSVVRLTPDQEEMVVRFTKVFEMTYRRFLDLKQAEAQAKEAKIEVALERVRSKTMAMHQSSELQYVIMEVTSQFQQLGFRIDNANFNINVDLKKNPNMTLWASSPGEQQYPSKIHIPYFDHPIFSRSIVNINKEIKFYSDTFTKEEKDSFYRYLFEHTELKNMAVERKQYVMNANGLARSVVILKSTALSILNYDGEPYTEEENEVLKRMGLVFDQAYTRFLDLEKAEAQAREAKIETALEKVRSRTMAMMHSDELAETAYVLFQQFKELNEAPDRLFIGIVNEEEGMIEFWITGWGGSQVNERFKGSIDEPVVFNKAYKAWKQQQKSLTLKISGTEHTGYLNYLKEIGFPVEETTYSSVLTNSFATFSKGYIGVVNIDSAPSETILLLERFASVFDLTYTRFLDLQKAEAQAREAQIELGLERVRARAMAMQKSGELKALIGTVFIELTKLDLVLTRCLIMIYDPESNGSTWWMANSEAPADPIGLYVKNHQLPPYEAYIKAWKDRKNKWQYILEGKDKNEWDDFLFVETELSHLPDFVIAGMKAPDKVYLNASFNSFGNLTLASLESLSTEHFDILLRFAKVFDLTYTRFNDLQKSEAQAREAKIETSLERVRAKTMGMHNSSDLLDVISVLSEQFQILGFNIHSANFNTSYRQKDWNLWLYNPGSPMYPDQLHIPYLDHPFFNRTLESLKKGSDFNAFVFTKEEKNGFLDHLYATTIAKNSPEERKKFFYNAPGFAWSAVYLKNTALTIANYDAEPYTEEENAILRRFGNVFEQTYTRFLDLQKAEAQTKEARIEAALERVRSSSLAMHNSSELKNVVKVVFEKLLELDFSIDGAAFIITYIEDSKDSNVWLADNNQLYPTCFRLPYNEAAPIKDFFLAKESGVAFFSKTYSFEVKNQWFRYAFEHTDFKNLAAQLKSWILEQEFLTQTAALAKKSLIGIHFHHQKSLSEIEVEILKRFSKVFDQAYIRFLDLQKAEAQAREAKIEAALERVRSRTMAMHQSEELLSVIAELTQQLRHLGFIIDTANFNTNYRNKDWDLWTNSGDGSTPALIHIPYFDHPIFNKVIEAIDNGESFFADTLQPKEKDSFLKHLFENTIYRNSPEEGKQALLSKNAFSYSVVFSKHTSATIGNYEGLPYSSEQNAILRRFGNVFEQSYTRFLDLQKAEAQTREAKIEASLERVRSKAMAMHSSQDLADTIVAFYHELEAFSLTPRRCGVGLLNKETHVAELSTMNTTEGGKSIEIIGKVNMIDHPVLEGVYDNWLLQKEYHPVLRGAEIKEYYQLLKPQISFPDYPHDTVHYGYFFFFTEGGVYAWTDKELEEDELKIYRRFTSVLSLTYKRYKDLQKAEAQARESQIEAALERVRSRTLAMQKSEELAETAAEVFKQLIGLGIEPNRLYIGIVQDESGDMEMWATDEDGTRIGKKFMFNKNENASVKKLFDGWMAKEKSVVVDMQGKELEDYFHYLNTVMHIPFKGGLSQKRRVQSVAYFSKGFIGMASPDGQGDDTIQLLERFAGVFNLTFTRFNDLKIAEAHAEQAELDLVQLKEEKKRTEDALNELQATQKQLIQSEKMASLGELTAGIAHEIQNPLNFVNNFSEISIELLGEMEDAMLRSDREEIQAIRNDIKQNLEKINHHGNRAGAIVKGMLQHSRSSNSATKELTDINKLADEYLRLAYYGLRAKDKSFNATMKTDYDESIGNINVIPQDIGRVILNLITNAFYTVNEKKKTGVENYEPTVSVITKKIKDKVEVSITDNGNGISKTFLDKIFQPFFTTKPTGQGTGLGLSLSYDIVKAHGGGLKVETSEGEGSTFKIQLPIS